MEFMQIDSVLPSYKLLGNEYLNVRRLQLTIDYTANYQKSTYYIAPGVGVVHRNVVNLGWNWMVHRYHVVQ